jgi:hypothetical protein
MWEKTMGTVMLRFSHHESNIFICTKLRNALQNNADIELWIKKPEIVVQVRTSSFHDSWLLCWTEAGSLKLNKKIWKEVLIVQ